MFLCIPFYEQINDADELRFGFYILVYVRTVYSAFRSWWHCLLLFLQFQKHMHKNRYVDRWFTISFTVSYSKLSIFVFFLSANTSDLLWFGLVRLCHGFWKTIQNGSRVSKVATPIAHRSANPGGSTANSAECKPLSGVAYTSEVPDHLVVRRTSRRWDEELVERLKTRNVETVKVNEDAADLELRQSTDHRRRNVELVVRVCVPRCRHVQLDHEWFLDSRRQWRVVCKQRRFSLHSSSL